VRVAPIRRASDDDQALHIKILKEMYPRYTYSIGLKPKAASSWSLPADYSCTRR
jgi:hypothetical protein